MYNKKRLNVKLLAFAGIMAGLSTVLFFLDFPIAVIFPGFLKIDFSDIPALVAAFLIGPLWGVAVELVKNIIHLTVTSTGGSGELANFIVGTLFVFTASSIYQVKKSRKSAIIGMVFGALAMVAGGMIANFFIIIPYYVTVMKLPLETIIEMCSKYVPFINSKLDIILFTIVPFNFMKGFIISIVTLIIYKNISKLTKHLGILK